ncbi:histidinol-phosphatase HisJ [Thalassorhabdus alkalitolerans]|uniref:Histidinol-phosphatase n=1 Tax=Thalassorhabdus alkalitolerans TaxID=2282697 RepID=A0ABW0YMX3_9BACI
MIVDRDGHVHTPFCPHGTLDPLEKYVEEAIKAGLKTITFAEHAPLPLNFEDPVPEKDSAMEFRQLDSYFQEIERVKMKYTSDILIKTGLEVDYIEGFESEVKAFLNEFGPRLDDAILSVHFLKKKQKNEYICLDYSPDSFKELTTIFESVEGVADKYYETVLKSIYSDLGAYKPGRIGHMTLVRKFQKKFTGNTAPKEPILAILNAIQDQGYELDYNGAGTAKPLCREPYPPSWVADEAMKRNIPLIYGSDAHQAKEMMQGSSQLL